MDTIRYDTDKKTIDDIVRLYRDNKLDLEPGFQRQSVWNTSDRKKLIDSIVRNYPLPSVFFYKKQENGDLIYYVIDGKQRIESILMFLGEMRGKFEAKCLLPGAERPEQVSWKMLKRKQLQHLITGYKLPIIEVDGELATVIELFVRINSTGKALTGQEKRHAKYYKSDFLKLSCARPRPPAALPSD